MNTAEQKIPKVGIAVILRKGEKILLGKRKGSHGEGFWAFPGGHLEYGESFEDCARREVLEETGLELGDIRTAAVTNDVFVSEGKHYATIFVTAEHIGGEPKPLEPHKCEKWEWFAAGSLPEPLFLPIVNLQKQGYLSRP